MENRDQISSQSKKWQHIVFGACLLISFFLPWVHWGKNVIRGFDLPLGKFFSVSATQFGLENPFPQLSFSFLIFWLIPLLTILGIIIAVNNKKSDLVVYIAGALALSMTTIFFLFTKTLIILGVGNNVFKMLQLPVYLAAISAIGFILTVSTQGQWLKKCAWLLLGPVLAFSAYKFGEKKVMAETYQTTDNVAADYTISATEMLNEFISSDSLANEKYREKIIVVNGNVSQIDRTSDSTTIIRFDDPAGSYIAFSFDKDQYELVKNIKAGDPVSLKGSCSGSIYSEILETTAINFKRSILNKNKNQ